MLRRVNDPLPTEDTEKGTEAVLSQSASARTLEADKPAVTPGVPSSFRPATLVTAPLATAPWTDWPGRVCRTGPLDLEK